MRRRAIARGRNGAQFRHARNNLLLRFDVELTDELYDLLIKQIQTGQAERLLKQSANTSHYKVTIDGKQLIAVYRKKVKAIVTFLPLPNEGIPYSG